MHFATYFWGGILWLTFVKNSEHFLSQSFVFHYDSGSTLNLRLLDQTAQLAISLNASFFADSNGKYFFKFKEQAYFFPDEIGCDMES